jgi:hypothetical protein
MLVVTNTFCLDDKNNLCVFSARQWLLSAACGCTGTSQCWHSVCAHHVAHGAYCAGGAVCGVLLDDPADAQVSQLGHDAPAGAAAHQHVARILRWCRQRAPLNDNRHSKQASIGAQIIIFIPRM